MKAYSAEIEFIAAEEWAADLRIIKYDIENRPEGEQLGGKSGSEASATFQKLRAVYPSIEISKLIEMTPEELQDAHDLSKILGQTRQVHEPTVGAFNRSINPFIDSKNSAKSGGQPAFWPLVKVVRLHLKAPILKNGLVLVDLPGLGDSNAGRTNVTESYLSNLHQIWVVSDIVRAVDEHIAKELLDRGFKMQLLCSGHYNQNFVSFIMTKTDQVNYVATRFFRGPTN